MLDQRRDKQRYRSRLCLPLRPINVAEIIIIVVVVVVPTYHRTLFLGKHAPFFRRAAFSHRRRPTHTCAVRLSDILGLALPSPAKLQRVLAQRRTTSTEAVLSAAREMIRMAPSSTSATAAAAWRFIACHSSV